MNKWRFMKLKEHMQGHIELAASAAHQRERRRGSVGDGVVFERRL
jgi:hypothetical protein